MYNKVIVKVIEKGKYMKVQTNKKYTTIAFYAVIVIAINVLLVVAVFKFNTILKLISTLFLNSFSKFTIIGFIRNAITRPTITGVSAETSVEISCLKTILISKQWLRRNSKLF